MSTSALLFKVGFFRFFFGKVDLSFENVSIRQPIIILPSLAIRRLAKNMTDEQSTKIKKAKE
jgi:hypothetical protein